MPTTLRLLRRALLLGLSVGLVASAACTPDATSVDPTCTDGKLDGSEADVDCGGPCAPCATGARCSADKDCVAEFCVEGICTEPSCKDGKKNETETDVDCGGASCPPCAAGRGCASGADCASSVCVKGTCAEPTCDDGKRNGTEVDVDCGGGTCPACGDGRACDKAIGCKSGVCKAGACAAASCTDGVKNGAEVEVDCGGGCLCAQGQTCGSNADCIDGVCKTTCQAPSCTDNVKNGGETSVDCGGPKCVPCATGLGCKVAADCASGVCTALHCAAPSCTDNVKNGDETDVDCGGPTCAPRCADKLHCAGDGDCKSLHCQATVCVAASCADGILNGDETAVDCGGSCAGCATGVACKQGGDCLDGVCDATGHCAAPSCHDGVKNGGETDVDCGGPTCARTKNELGCANGKACVLDGDCVSGACAFGLCVGHATEIGAGGIDDIAQIGQGQNPNGTTLIENLFIGSFHGTVDFGTGPLSSMGGKDIFVAEYNLDGTPLWVQTFGGPGDDEGLSITAIGGYVTIAGSFTGTVGLPLGLVSNGGKDAFVAALKYDSGLVQWARSFGGSGLEVASAVEAAFDMPAVAVAGYFDSPTVDFGSGLVPSNGGSSFVLWLDATTGAVSWSKILGGATPAHGAKLSAGYNYVTVAVASQGDQDLGCGNLPALGGLDVLEASLDRADGHCLWSNRYGGAGDDYPTAFVTDPQQTRVLAGAFVAPANFGGPQPFNVGTMFVARHANASGAHVDSTAFGGGGGVDEIRGLGTDGKGNLYVAGRFSSPSVSFGGPALMNQGAFDVFLAKLTNDFKPLASARYGGAGDEELTALGGSANNDEIVLAGTFDASIDFGFTKLLATAPQDTFVANLGTFP